MTDVLSPGSVGLRPVQAGQSDVELSTGLGLLLAAWISLGLWAGVIGIVARLTTLLS